MIKMISLKICLLLLISVNSFGYAVDTLDDFVCFTGHGEGGIIEPVYALVFNYKTESDAEVKYFTLTNSRHFSNAVYGLIGLKIIASEDYNRCRDTIAAKFGKPTQVAFSTGGCTGICMKTVMEVLSIVDENEFNKDGIVAK